MDHQLRADLFRQRRDLGLCQLCRCGHGDKTDRDRTQKRHRKLGSVPKSQQHPVARCKAARQKARTGTANRSLKLRETNDVINTIKAFCAEDATIIHGTVFDDNMGDTLRVTVVATGIGRKAAAARPVLVPTVTQRTGTDDAAAPRTGLNYNDYDQPAVWRSPRASAAAQVQALEESGVERLDIPAFLRTQAD